jgi:hypothetical protein
MDAENNVRLINRKLYYPLIPNFGDDLNGELFRIFGANFIHTTNVSEADFIAIGSGLNGFIYKQFNKSKKEWLKQRIRFIKGNEKIIVLGTGFWHQPEFKNVKFICNMDFKFVRGNMTKKILLENKLVNDNLLTGDLGLLAPYVYPNNTDKKYKLGIIPHLDDLDSPIMFEIYKKYKSECIYINVKETPEKVIRQIQSCETVVSTSLHGLIVADSFGIPNLWLENKFKRIEKPIFKYFDYYSSLDIIDIQPIQAIDFLNSDIKLVEQLYRINLDKIKEKQNELFYFCKEYLDHLAN